MVDRRPLVETFGLWDVKKVTGCKGFGLCLWQWPALASEEMNHASSPNVLETICVGLLESFPLGSFREVFRMPIGYRKERACRGAASFERRVLLFEEEIQEEDMSRLTF